MTTRVALIGFIALRCFLFLPLSLLGRTLESSEYQYCWVVPDDAFVDETDTLNVFIAGQDFAAKLHINKSEDGVFIWRNAYKACSVLPEGAEWIVKPSRKPYLNFLKHSTSCVYKLEDIYVHHKLDFRSKTSFSLYINTLTPESPIVQQLENSLDLRQTFKSYLLIMRNNIGGLLGTILLSLLCFFAYGTRKWKYGNPLLSNLCKIGCLAILVITVVGLRDYWPLAIVVGLIVILIWWVFASKSNFLRSVVTGFFN